MVVAVLVKSEVTTRFMVMEVRLSRLRKSLVLDPSPMIKVVFWGVDG